MNKAEAKGNITEGNITIMFTIISSSPSSSAQCESARERRVALCKTDQQQQQLSEFRSFVKVEVAVLGSPS